MFSVPTNFEVFVFFLNENCENFSFRPMVQEISAWNGFSSHIKCVLGNPKGKIDLENQGVTAYYVEIATKHIWEKEWAHMD